MELFYSGGCLGRTGVFLKKLVSVNLFGMWLLADVLLVLAGWYVWVCKKYRGLC